MRKIVASEFITLDGVVESPEQWQSPYFNDEMGQAVGAAFAASDAMLLGRRTYDTFAAAFGSDDRAGDPMTARMNETPKFVVSTTLDTVGWRNSTLIRGDLAEEVTKLKRRPGKSIAVSGSATLVRSLVREGLLDELKLLVCPIVVGSGQRLFEDGDARVPLRLANATTFRTGVLSLTYARADG
jgi:dihydrofolate reductase